MICSLENVLEIFARMEADGWNTATPLKWGFFFVHSTKEPLNAVFAELKGHNYKVESLHQTDDGKWVLQVSKTEVLPAEKLHRRNVAFNDLAEHCGVELYDGWDVGKAEE
jgi:hypothetical protein